jgi:hypothetical protein
MSLLQAMEHTFAPPLVPDSAYLAWHGRQALAHAHVIDMALRSCGCPSSFAGSQGTTGSVCTMC